ncbi:MAG TPA: SRPBCC family protein [Nitrospirota bacterium]|nr:SRPBCC family protein [Nitrospirota bacterium]
MSVLITIHVILISFVLVVFLVGLFLPNRKAVRRTAELHALPEEIWAIMTNHEQQPRWRRGLKKVEIRERTPEGEVWTEYPTAGPAVTYRTRETNPNLRYELEMTGTKAMRTHRVLELEKKSIDVTRLDVTEYVDVKNPFIRVVAYLQFDPGSAIEQYLDELSAEAARVSAKLESQTS